MMPGDISDHFSRWEVTCKCGCGFNTADYELVIVVEDVREHFGQKVTINSWCRCKMHNVNEGGKPSSQHLLGKGSDIVVENVPANVVAGYLENKYFSKYGIGRYDDFTHIDVRSGLKARWDNRTLQTSNK